MNDPLKAQVRLAVRQHEREFTLSSGRTSRIYVDGKRVTLDPTGSRLLGERFADWLAQDRPDAFGGPELGACPIVSATGVIASQRGLAIALFYVRKAPKGHGTATQIEGPRHEPGMTAILVEDVVTTAGSMLRAVEVVRTAGLRVTTAYCMVDREEGGTEALATAGITLRGLYRLSELV